MTHLPSSLTCADCGYALTGLASDGTCPECGKPIAESAERASVLHKRELAELGCKLMAIWVLMQLVAVASQVGWIISFTMSQVGIANWIWVVGIVVQIVVYAGLGYVLWWRASWLARWIFKQDGVVKVGGPLGAKDLTTAVFTIAGLLIVIFWGVAPLLTLLVQSLIEVPLQIDESFLTEAIYSVIMMVIGLALLVWTGALVRVIAWLRTAGSGGKKVD